MCNKAIFFLTFFLLCQFNLLAQSAVQDPQALSYALTKDYKTDKEKVYSIFRWVTDNIGYRLKPIPTIYKTIDTSASKTLDEIVAEDVLKKGLAVCDGYTRLFKTLCTYAGISCDIVKGYARDEVNFRPQRFFTNHTWNAVLIDSTWHLLDVTWASGYVSYRGDYFVRDYEPRYFLASPQDFIKDHYPEDPTWALLPAVPTLQEFNHTPFRTSAFIRSKVKGFFPAKGVIEAETGETIMLQVELEGKERNLFLTDGTVRVESATQRPRKTFAYQPTEKGDKWLEVVYDDEVILRYKLLVKQKSQ